jgi:hypothetical protein
MKISEDLIKCTVAFLGGAAGGFVAGFSLGENYAKDEISARAEKEEAEKESEDDPEVIVRFPSKRQEIEEPVNVDSEEDEDQEKVVEKPEEAEDKEE